LPQVIFDAVMLSHKPYQAFGRVGVEIVHHKVPLGGP
jgi:hypothetical protein